jgi:hypothetical protein
LGISKTEVWREFEMSYVLSEILICTPLSLKINERGLESITQILLKGGQRNNLPCKSCSKVMLI